jgi:hypothetical protein
MRLLFSLNLRNELMQVQEKQECVRILMQMEERGFGSVSGRAGGNMGGQNRNENGT